MKIRKKRIPDDGIRHAAPLVTPAASITAAALCLLLLLLNPGGRWARAQEETPPVPETPGEGVSQAGQVYFYLDGVLTPVAREVAAGPQAAEFTVMELLNGPKEEEKAQGYVTYIPEGVKLRYTTVKQDRSEFSVNLSSELMELSGDRERAIRALAQLVKTLREVTGIEKIGVFVDLEETGAQPEDAFKALGVTPREVEEEISGPLPSGVNWWLILLLAVGIPALVLLVVLALMHGLRKRSNPGKVKPVVGTSSRPTMRVKRRRDASPPPPAPWKEPRNARKGRKKGRKRDRKED
ncbi:MAG: GerMN domain-containing protein [Actinobacteria bacterium]|nr:GerMN domain-containing protein [Actinomycetota bacterium]